MPKIIGGIMFRKNNVLNNKNSKKPILYGVVTFLAVVILVILSVFTVKLIRYGKEFLKSSETNLLNDTDEALADLQDDNAFIIKDENYEIDKPNTDLYSDNINTDDTQNTVNDTNSDNNIDTEINNGLNNDANEDKSIKDIDRMTQNEDKDDPQHESFEGIDLDVRDIEKSKNETDEITFGIDVSKWQGIIDWKKVKDAGVEFAIIRIGYRTQVDGKIIEDPYAEYNLQQAQKYGIKLGAYFFSTAINEKEALEEAKWVVDFLAPYKITYPVVYNCEGFTDPENRQYKMTKEERTKLVTVFLDYIKENGYTPMFYAAKGELENSKDWDTTLLTKKYKIWVAQYTDYIDISNPKSTYSGSYDMWQYTSNGSVPGIKGHVDLNVAYFGYKKEAKAKEEKPLEEVKPDPAALINFTEVNELVTAKEVTNLRNIPSLQDSEVIEILYYGDKATRTGIADNGWSRVEYKGKILYAISSYLTTDFNYRENSKPTVKNPEAGITFTEVNDKVTAKIRTNLRLVPSTESDDTIVAVLEHGVIVTRTGIGSNGWSRVEYEGQTLYAVTSYLEIVDDENQN